ncbi:MAG: very short patch repair endonuclease [Candidatus Lokiarchaeia archaeon]
METKRIGNEMDIWSKEKRSMVMSQIHSKNTKPEQIVRKILTDLGYRYRLNVKDLPGKPDIVLRKYNTVVFVHGCFWHLHKGCRDGTIPKTRKEYWQTKLLRNKERDIKHFRELRKQGWKVLRIWECEIEKKPDWVKDRLLKFLSSENKI